MTHIKRKMAGKAAKATAKHTAHGAASKLKRDRMRTGTLLVFGLAVGFVLGRVSGNEGEVSHS
jgi:hypothetical protein